MWKTILRRVLLMIPQIIILSLLVFFLAKLMPGDPFSGKITPHTDPQTIEKLKQQLGLYDPPLVQYGHWVQNIFKGDFGQSYTYDRPVIGLIGERAANTLWLSLLTTIMTYAVAIPLGLFAGKHEGKWQDRLVAFYNFITRAVPPFAVYLILLILFSFILKIFPSTGTVSATAHGFWQVLWSRIYHMLLPAIAMTLTGTTGIVQYLRSGIIDNTQEDYVRTARAKGVPEKVIFRKHILRNSFLPIASSIGLTITGLLGGAIVAEGIFSYPGMGQLFLQSVTSRDYSVMITLTLLFGTLTLIGNLLSDIIMSIVDPRIRIQ
ncbi:ABC transporter permease [Xylocopilactobacillus apicola]|uniref:Peptide ABC transporter permease n=1 Tax=Xylocopilactobacillus apicola TaxID=2932184 RepID=A0AAU9DE86_9LACO|nr:ABC transporter permease [Xylocopilactobacillus apicola]BDR58170.1 peptide ABC transporter permease [Xylocopilactobacillus apicola]